MSHMRGRLAQAATLGAMLALIAGCSAAGAPQAPRSASVAATQGMVTPAVGLSPPSNVSLAEGLAQMERSVSLPDTQVAGIPDAVVLDRAPTSARTLRLHYPNGVFLKIRPNTASAGGTLDVRATFAASAGFVHPDGTPSFSLERIAGRDTLVGTMGEVLKDGELQYVRTREIITWVDNGYVYELGPSSVTGLLGEMRRMAASIQ